MTKEEINTMQELMIKELIIMTAKPKRNGLKEIEMAALYVDLEIKKRRLS